MEFVSRMVNDVGESKTRQRYRVSYQVGLLWLDDTIYHVKFEHSVHSNRSVDKTDAPPQAKGVTNKLMGTS